MKDEYCFNCGRELERDHENMQNVNMDLCAECMAELVTDPHYFVF